MPSSGNSSLSQAELTFGKDKLRLRSSNKSSAQTNQTGFDPPKSLYKSILAFSIAHLFVNALLLSLYSVQVFTQHPKCLNDRSQNIMR